MKRLPSMLLALLLAGDAAAWTGIEILGQTVAPGEARRVDLSLSESFAGASVATPVFVVQGMESGTSLCLTAGIHGDELDGVEIVRQVLELVKPEELKGTLLAVPIVNAHGFRRSSRYGPDRRDLNRYFPGRPKGSSASRIAFALFEGVVRNCKALVDFHTGSFHRTNLPQVRVDMRSKQALRLAEQFGVALVVHNPGRRGTLRHAANTVGIPTITYEAGEPMRLSALEIRRGVLATLQLLETLGMIDGPEQISEPQEIYRQTHWVRVDDGGLLVSRVRLGDRVAGGDILGIVTDPIDNEKVTVVSRHAGRVIGMAVDQVVVPGFAAYHLAVPGGRDRPVFAEPAEDSIDEDEAPGAEQEERPE